MKTGLKISDEDRDLMMQPEDVAEFVLAAGIWTTNPHKKSTRRIYCGSLNVIAVKSVILLNGIYIFTYFKLMASKPDPTPIRALVLRHLKFPISSPFKQDPEEHPNFERTVRFQREENK